MAFSPSHTVLIEVSDQSCWIELRPELPNAMVTNLGPGVAFIRFGTGPQRASASSDMPVLANRHLLLAKGVGADAIAAVTGWAGEITSLYVTVGIGE